MYNSYYGLSANPFDKQALKEKDAFLSNDHREALSRLNYLKDIRGIGVLTATPGMGKSFALRCFARELNRNLYQMEYLCLSTISVSEFYKQLCHAFKLEITGGKASMFQAIQERIYYLYKEKKRPFILAIDEAQYLSSGILKDLKMIMNQGYDSLNCFTLILCGEPYLNNTLEMGIHEALKQRITVHYNYQGLDDCEVSSYIHHKLTIAGAAPTIMSEAAVSSVHSHSQGNPRVIDNLMTNALTLGAQMEKPEIDAEVILASINAYSLT